MVLVIDVAKAIKDEIKMCIEEYLARYTTDRVDELLRTMSYQKFLPMIECLIRQYLNTVDSYEMFFLCDYHDLKDSEVIEKVIEKSMCGCILELGRILYIKRCELIGHNY